MTDWKKRAEEILRTHGYSVDLLHNVYLAMLQLGQEMADARAEEIARAFERRDMNTRETSITLLEATQTARSFISHKKTREEVLEEALRLGERMFRDTLWAKAAREALGDSPASQEEFHL